MDETGPGPAKTEQDLLVRAVRRLTTAVWCVAIGLFVLLAMYLFSYARFFWFTKGAVSSDTRVTRSSSTTGGPSFFQRDEFEGKQFHELTNEKKIKYATVILLTRHEKDSKGHVKSVISEVVKQKPGTELHYKVGEEFSPYGYAPSDETCAGDGEIVLMVGSPAQMRESSSYTGDRLDSMGGMTLAELRELAKRGTK